MDIHLHDDALIDFILTSFLSLDLKSPGFWMVNGKQSEKISKLINAANLTVESFWPILFAKLAEKKNIEELMVNVGSGGVAAPGAVSAPASGASAPAAPAAEEKKV